MSNTTSKFYPKLFEHLRLNKNGNGTTLKNRILMGSMHTGLEGHSFPRLIEQLRSKLSNNKNEKLERLAEFYASRARGGVGLIITGGFSPNSDGVLYPFGSKLDSDVEMEYHKVVTSAVRESSVRNYEYPESYNCYRGYNDTNDNDVVNKNNNHHVDDYETKMCLQILHAGRYAAHPFAVSSTSRKSPISPFSPRKMEAQEVQKTIDDFIRSSVFAKEAGYHGVEVMGSEGYLINQFLSPYTAAGKSFEERVSFPMKILRGIRDACGDDFIIIYRISLADLVSKGMPWEEVVELARRLDTDGAVSILNAGIGWHESRVPTIATSVPRGAWNWTVEKLKESLPDLSIPVSVVNRINSPHVAEKLLTGPSSADLVTLARPFLADELFAAKAFNGHSELINTCIGCNQACLDHVFVGKTASCLVNPTACHETEFDFDAPRSKQRIAIIGAGPAGLSCAITSKKLGHDVTLFDKSDDIGGQFNLAKLIPGKQEFYETLRYFRKHLALLGVHVQLGINIDESNMSDLLGKHRFDKVILASGVYPRIPSIDGVNHAKVMSYYDLLTGKENIGDKVAILGAGGIGFDVADYLLHRADSNDSERHEVINKSSDIVQPLDESSPADQVDSDAFFRQWGVDRENHEIATTQPLQDEVHRRTIYLLQRKSGKLGASLGKTTGWIHRLNLKNNKVNMLDSVSYDKIDDKGLHITRTGKNGVTERMSLDVDNIILCTGQESNRILLESLQELYNDHQRKSHPNATKHVYVIGGAYQAGELDAKRAIDMGMRMALRIHENNVDEDNLKELITPEEKWINALQKLV